MRRVLRHLTARHRTVATNRTLGLMLAFNAGAMNAGGFMAVHMYTSHMTGFLATLADSLVIGEFALALAAVGALWAFMSGAGTTAILVNWGRRQRLHGTWALPLLLEAVLMLRFGLLGAIMLQWPTPFAVPLAVLLLAFMMGVQNAVVTKMSSAQIRTTHMTGVVTDLGMELGKMLYWNRTGTPRAARVRANRERVRLYASLLALFVIGGVLGAAAFQHYGFIWVVPQAALLLGLSLPPLLMDTQRLAAWWRSRPGRRPDSRM